MPRLVGTALLPLGNLLTRKAVLGDFAARTVLSTDPFLVVLKFFLIIQDPFPGLGDETKFKLFKMLLAKIETLVFGFAAIGVAADFRSDVAFAAAAWRGCCWRMVLLFGWFFFVAAARFWCSRFAHFGLPSVPHQTYRQKLPNL